MGKLRFEPSRPLQVVVGALGILLIGGVIALAWRLTFVEGFVGEMFATLVGVFSTPILLESSLIVMGLIVVILINAVRQKREGDEFVYLEQVDAPDAAKLPAQAREAIYREKPELTDALGEFDLIEGALEIEDWSQAGERLQDLSASDFDSRRGLELRLRLAMGTGRRNSAGKALARLRELDPDSEVLKLWDL
mgnify:CR=1 FL=1